MAPSSFSILDLWWGQARRYSYAMHIDQQLFLSSEKFPWMPVKPGFRIKHLHGSAEDETRTVLLSLQPGTVIERHRHEGEVHAFNVAGYRKLLDTGEVVGPGDYVYEPAGNVDSWMAVGDTECIVFVTVRGALEEMDAEGKVYLRITTPSAAESYRKFCAELGR